MIKFYDVLYDEFGVGGNVSVQFREGVDVRLARLLLEDFGDVTGIDGNRRKLFISTNNVYWLLRFLQELGRVSEPYRWDGGMIESYDVIGEGKFVIHFRNDVNEQLADVLFWSMGVITGVDIDGALHLYSDNADRVMNRIRELGSIFDD